MEKQVHVSFYASLFRTECKVLTLEEIIILIRRRRLKNEILALCPPLNTPEGVNPGNPPFSFRASSARPSASAVR